MARRISGGVVEGAAAGTGSANAVRQSQPQQTTKDQVVTRTNPSVTKKGLTSVTGNRSAEVGGGIANIPEDNRSYMKMNDSRNLMRIPPWERDIMTHDRFGHFYAPGFHFFGYRVQALPPSYRHVRRWGRDYYYFDDVYYRRWGDYYRVCRPPFGVVFDVALRNLAFSSVRFAYYYDTYHIMNVIDSNYKTILRQNEEIARNNAVLARQNAAIALNSDRAYSAYELATRMGLVQSYAGLSTEYYYDDGVFYVLNKKGQYEVIVPPAGALVEELPDDYETLVMDGIEYYLVDETVYRLTLVDGTPYLEVLGQMTASMVDNL